MKLHAFLIMAILLLEAEATLVSAQSSLPKMVLKLESREGNPVDLAGPSNVLEVEDIHRIWGGGGRRRNAWEPNSRDRNFDEEAKDFQTGTAAFEVDVSSPLAIEHRLFTLTSRGTLKNDLGAVATIIPARLRVDNIFSQIAPVLLQEIIFGDFENPLFMRVAPADKLLLVGILLDLGGGIGSSEIRIFSYASGLLVPVGSAVLPPPDPLNLTSCDQFFRTPQDLQVASIQTVETAPGSGVWLEERMAIVSATLSSYPPPPPPIEPPCSAGALAGQTRGLLLLNIEDPANPFWLDADLGKQSWDPCRQGENCDLWFTAGFCHVRAPVAGAQPRDYVYITGGPEVGITRIDLTNVADPAVGIPPEHKATLWPDGQEEGLFAIRPDPENSNLLYVYGRRNAFVVDRTSVDQASPASPQATYEKSPSDLNFTNAGDAHLVLVDTGTEVERESWTLGRSSVRHVLRVTDFTQDGSGTLVAPAGMGHFSAGPTDGAAADFSTSSVYALTFGGVARWDISGSEPIPDVDSYRPATVGGVNHTTEDLVLADLSKPSDPPDRQLIANTADGGFVSWRVDPTTHDPGLAVRHEPLDPVGYWSSSLGYGNDIDVWEDSFGSKVVILDYSASMKPLVLPHGQIGIGAMRWSNKAWISPSITWQDPGNGPGGWAIEPHVRDLHVHKNCVVAGANGGFIVARIPLHTVSDYVYTNDIAGLGFSRVLGVAIHGNRLFVSLGDTGNAATGDPNNRFAFAMYGFNPSLGIVVDSSGNPTESPLRVLFDGQTLPVSTMPPSAIVVDAFPGIFLEGGQQLALVQISADPLKLRLFSGSSNGYTVEIEYDGSTDLITPKSYGHNGGYFASIAEAKPYLVAKPIGGPPGFGAGLSGPVIDYELRLLVTKTMETFEIVNPPDLQ